MQKWLDFQRLNIFLYVPILMTTGAALYFTMPFEPYIPCALLISILLIAVACISKIPVYIRAIVLFCFGFTWAAAYTHIINTPRMPYDMRDKTINAIVQHVDPTPDKTYLYLNIDAKDIQAGDGMATVRVSVKGNPNINSGDTINANINLYTPNPPSAPETFDWARWTYFNKITATGSATDIQIIKHADTNTYREMIHNTAKSFLVDSLVLGYKHALNPHEDEIWTTVGVGHIWSISGFHMTLVGGWIFAIFYLIFRSIPYITRRIPAKIPGLCCAWLCLIGYLILSGCDVATMRAFGMTTLMFSAFIFGRNAFSLRNVALVFCALFFINPHYVMQAGFQLSFAAAFGLIWIFSVIKPRMPNNKLMRIGYSAILTTITATVFTMPFVMGHFGTIPTYSLIGNLILLPIFSVAIMPLVICGTILSPFGFSGMIDIAHRIYGYALEIAEYIANLPLATIDVPHVSNFSMMCFVIGLVCLAFIRSRNYIINTIGFIIFVSIGTANIFTEQRPIFFTTHDNELVGFVDDNGRLEFNKSRASNHYFAFNTWKELNNEPIYTPNPRRRHDNGVYSYKTQNFNIVYIQKFVPLMHNLTKLCNDENVDYIVSYWDITSDKCAHKILDGGFVIYPSGRIKFTPSNRKWY